MFGNCLYTTLIKSILLIVFWQLPIIIFVIFLCFVPDHNSPESSLAAHAKMWRALPPQTKEEYRKEAEARKANGPPPPANEQERQKRIKHLMKRMNPVVSIFFQSLLSDA